MLTRTPTCSKGGTSASEDSVKKQDDRRMFLKTLNAGKSGRIVFKAGTEKLYYDFRYQGKRHEKTTGLVFTVDNAVEARKNLDEMMNKIQAGTFCYAANFPNSDLVSKTLHTQQEMNSKQKRPDQITIRTYIEGTPANDYKDGWLNTSLPGFDPDVQFAYQRDINYWILPLYGDLTFAELSGDKLYNSMKDFTVHRKGEPLSGIRIKTIFTPLDRILKSARSKYKWRDLEDPIQYLKDNGLAPKRIDKPLRQLLFREFIAVRSHLNVYHQHIATFMALTGMIASELAGLRKTDLFMDYAKPYLYICNKIIEGNESENLKTHCRKREQHITRQIRNELEFFITQSPDNYVFTKTDGTPYCHEDFTKEWKKAMKLAGIRYVKPYVLRHCFAGWSKIIGIELSWLQHMMGHSTMDMLFTRYGRHKFGLEDDRESIIEFFGMDYLRLGNASSGITFAKVAKGSKLGEIVGEEKTT